MTRKLSFGSLFAGIGGMDLGLERAGMECKWQVETGKHANKILGKHWPNVRRHGDVRTFPPGGPSDWRVDLIAGGFPCQDVSSSGKGAGLDGSRSGLFYEALRVVQILRPRFVLLENVAALLHRGLSRVLRSLATIGLDAEWHCIPAGAFGAPHLRQRIFIVAYAPGDTIQGPILSRSKRPEGFQFGEFRGGDWRPAPGTYWETSEPGLSDLDDGFPGWVGAVSGLGNAVVPQVAEWIGKRIVEAA